MMATDRQRSLKCRFCVSNCFPVLPLNCGKASRGKESVQKQERAHEHMGFFDSSLVFSR